MRICFGVYRVLPSLIMTVVKSLGFSMDEIESMGRYGVLVLLTSKNSVYFVIKKIGGKVSVRDVSVTESSDGLALREGETVSLNGNDFILSLLVDPTRGSVKVTINSITETYSAKLPLLPGCAVRFNCEIPDYIVD